MKRDIFPKELVRNKKWKKFQKKSKSRRVRARKHKRLIKERKANFKSSYDISLLDRLFIFKEVSNANGYTPTDKHSRKIEIKVPPVFDMFKHPEAALEVIFSGARKMMSGGLRQVFIDHSKVERNSLASEALLGLIVAEILRNRRQFSSEEINIWGKFPRKSKASRQIVSTIGLVKELNDKKFEDANDSEHQSDIHYFRYDNRYTQSTSVKEDKKRIVTEGCVKYLEKCMNAHSLTILESARNKLKACLGEVLDNAEEHCSRTKSVWFVRGYFNDVEHERYLELSVFNLGRSIFDSFDNLPDTSKVKNTAKGYVDRHKKLVDETALFSVAALQGNISSKKDIDHTRGQGTVTLIETFETIYENYKSLRATDNNMASAQMNIISGNTVINFDGRFSSKLVEVDGGGEIFLMPFNEKGTLDLPPDSKCVYTMKRVNFPGVMINIRIPLQGSTVPLVGDSK
ncbi:MULTISPECIES: hypothetical protein [Pantoea]|uniref:hypothetical protein n=1 Tax=Pantoea TaxID=53335 RepID=UPI000D5E3D93|nr:MULTISPECIES: hypothetical protein [Pantoea]MCH9408105.1 hypothetical protein [Pantoea agglomerans]PVY82135.1 hypothetical protein C7427_11236 [Pantoea ananatis]WNK33363.1 hypothetical protein RM157_22915 [Pantoea agglomerans]WNK60693.1 hypothetical protein RM151_22410 [Pantoea agglomerans]WNK65110.1 hypothetical protein RM152_22375 [Pantoea agglomerans]